MTVSAALQPATTPTKSQVPYFSHDFVNNTSCTSLRPDLLARTSSTQALSVTACAQNSVTRSVHRSRLVRPSLRRMRQHRAFRLRLRLVRPAVWR